MNLIFGPAGNEELFYRSGFKSTLDSAKYISKMGLFAFEYPLTHGIRLSEKTAVKIGESFKRENIKLSIHAPYYINITSPNPEILEKSEKHLIKAIQFGNLMSADRIIFHPGSSKGDEREIVLERSIIFLEQFICKNMKLIENIKLCPETHGKSISLGNVDEIVEICKINPDIFLPAIDFAHLFAVGKGNLTQERDFTNIFKKFKDYKEFHIHFSQIEFNDKGEVRHKSLNSGFGPPIDPFLLSLLKNSIRGRVIVETPGTQARDAKILLERFLELEGKGAKPIRQGT
ncbi:Xylose isomerase domain-containing protein TIM barrel [Thermodesulfobium narugense DSM 14796]|uniref:Xylose isomerase domain-containing protein TIM barrel n=1 Tax=Thermodesulfobium narugense DSM 14796 TaxID=747365 RepID=M1E7D3_9BACT|nr:TIM barrel protein [Thermodesulfobium narugense]AEE15226.1 Xylose isomerase domain-containing protein TIM barrel [Thermodesulfobium narugense DSM 14796]